MSNLSELQSIFMGLMGRAPRQAAQTREAADPMRSVLETFLSNTPQPHTAPPPAPSDHVLERSRFQIGRESPPPTSGVRPPRPEHLMPRSTDMSPGRSPAAGTVVMRRAANGQWEPSSHPQARPPASPGIRPTAAAPVVPETRQEAPTPSQGIAYRHLLDDDLV